MFPKLIDWTKKNPLLAIAIAVGAWYVLSKRQRQLTMVVLPPDEQQVEQFSTCLQHKQIVLNSCDQSEPSNHADVNIEKRWGKLYISINANLPYAQGGVFHTMYGAYHAFLINSASNESINLGTLVRHGDRWYKLATELLGQYDGFDRIDVYRQTEDYQPKRVLTGSITNQLCTSSQ